MLLGVPITAYLNDASHRYGRAGYYVCSAVAAISAILMFFIGYPAGGRQNVSKYSANGSITSHCTMPTSECPDLLNQSFSSGRYGNWYNTTPFTTTMSNGCKSSSHQHYTPTHTHSNGNAYHGSHCPNGHGSGGGGMANGGGGRHHGRLQKSLSFAFQTPTTWSDYNYPATCYNTATALNYSTIRPHSR